MWFMLVTLAVVLLLTVMVVWWMSRSHDTFKKMGIPTPPPTILLGNFGLMAKLGIFKVQTEYYSRFKDQKVYGWYEGRDPVLVIRDLELIKDMFVKHFNSFCDRRNVFDHASPVREMLPVLKGDHWKHVRNVVSPTFSSARVKRMSLHVERSMKLLVDFLREKQESNEEIELKHVCSCSTLDAIASTGFGLDIDTLRDPDNAFATNARKVITFSVPMLLTALLFPEVTKIFSMLNLPFAPKKAVKYITDIVDAAIEGRKASTEDTKAKDFLQLIMDAEEADEVEKGRLTRVEIQAQGLVFILDGFDTVSSALSFTLFLLANHPEACQKVQQEIDQLIGKEAPNYDNVQSLPYLEMCINESLRMFPPSMFIDRKCTETIDLEGLHIPKGMSIFIPLYAIHHDPEIWPEPDKFQPERFSPENKEFRHPYAHLPFGQGPRICIGMRLAMLEMKVAIAFILQNFNLVPCEKTVYPVRLSKMLFKAEDGLWVKVERRK